MAVGISSSYHCLIPPRFPRRYHLKDHERGEGHFDPLLSPSDYHKSSETAMPLTPHRFRLQQNRQTIRLFIAQPDTEPEASIKESSHQLRDGRVRRR
jgi:hypothetical protein